MGTNSGPLNTTVIVFLVITITGATSFRIFSPLISSTRADKDADTSVESQNEFLRCLEVCDLLTFKRKSTTSLTECISITCPSLVKHPSWSGSNSNQPLIDLEDDQDEDDEDAKGFQGFQRKVLTRTKKWQYADPMQMCMMSKCQGLSGVDFYQCVYSKCITGDKEKEER